MMTRLSKILAGVANSINIPGKEAKILSRVAINRYRYFDTPTNYVRTPMPRTHVCLGSHTPPTLINQHL